MAIAWRTCGCGRAYDRARARLVVNDDGLLPFIGQAQCDDARQDIGHAAGGVGHDDLHRFGREAGCRLCTGCRCNNQRGEDQC